MAIRNNDDHHGRAQRPRRKTNLRILSFSVPFQCLRAFEFHTLLPLDSFRVTPSQLFPFACGWVRSYTSITCFTVSCV